MVYSKREHNSIPHCNGRNTREKRTESNLMEANRSKEKSSALFLRELPVMSSRHVDVGKQKKGSVKGETNLIKEKKNKNRRKKRLSSPSSRPHSSPIWEVKKSILKFNGGENPLTLGGEDDTRRRVAPMCPECRSAVSDEGREVGKKIGL